MASGQADQQRETAKYTCSYPGCDSSFGRRQELERHEREFHGPPRYCPFLDCRYQTQRTARLRKHLETEHGYSHQESVQAVPDEDSSTAQAGQTLHSSGQASQSMAYNPPYPTTSNSTPAFSQTHPNSQGATTSTTGFNNGPPVYSMAYNGIVASASPPVPPEYGMPSQSIHFQGQDTAPSLYFPPAMNYHSTPNGSAYHQQQSDANGNYVPNGSNSGTTGSSTERSCGQSKR